VIYFFPAQFNNNSNKKIFQPMGSTRPDPTGVGLGWTYVMDWVEFFLTHHDGLGQKIPPIRPMHTPTLGFMQNSEFVKTKIICEISILSKIMFWKRDFSP